MKNRGTGRRICRQRAESANESWAHIQQKMQARPEQRTAQRLATRMRGDSSIHLVEGSVPLGLHARDLGRRLEADEKYYVVPFRPTSLDWPRHRGWVCANRFRDVMSERDSGGFPTVLGLQRMCKEALLPAFVCFAVALSFLLLFAARNGYEGDDIAQISGAMHLADRGPAGVYRYALQPLSYELASFIVRKGGLNRFISFLPQIAGAAALAGFVLGVRRYSNRQIPWVVAAGFVFLVPELIISGLYFNSTVFSMCAMSWAV